MTKLEFIREYGADWRKFASKPMFAALLTVMDDESPAKTPPAAESDRLHGAAVFLNEIYGWERLRAMIESLASTPERHFEPEDKFAEPEKI